MTAPLMAVVSIVLYKSQGRPIFFSQSRAGQEGRPFLLKKFRTMADAHDEAGRLLPDDRRITPIGRRLRATSLDELPELWNVITGDMSLVGPRPLPIEYLPRYTSAESHRHEVRPGLTGWAQVNGRNTVDWDDRLAMDVWYVEHRSLTLDLKIVLRTIAVVLRRQGISASDTETMTVLRPHLAEDPPGFGS